MDFPLNKGNRHVTYSQINKNNENSKTPIITCFSNFTLFGIILADCIIKVNVKSVMNKKSLITLKNNFLTLPK